MTAIELTLRCVDHALAELAERVEQMPLADLQGELEDLLAGGKGHTSRYKPVLMPVKPSGKPEGLGDDLKGLNPPENRAQTLRKSARKPSGKPEGNPYEEPYKDSRAGSHEPAHGLSSTINGGSRRRNDAPPISSHESAPNIFRVGAWRTNPSGERYLVLAMDDVDRMVTVRFENGREGTTRAPEDAVLITKDLDDEGGDK